MSDWRITIAGRGLAPEQLDALARALAQLARWHGAALDMVSLQHGPNTAVRALYDGAGPRLDVV